MPGAALLANDLADKVKFVGHPLVGRGNIIEAVGKLAEDADMVACHAGRKIACPQGLQGIKEFVKLPVVKFRGGRGGGRIVWGNRLEGSGDRLGRAPLLRSDILHDHR